METIALITPLTTSDMWKSLHAGVHRGCLDEGCVRYWNAPTHEHDFDRQIELMEQERNRNVAGIILVPSDSSALVSAVADAHNAGVPIVIAENRLTMKLAAGIPMIESDNAAIGVLAAKEIAERLQEHGTVAIIGFDLSQTSSVIRTTHFVAEIRQHHPGVRIYSKRFEAGPSNPMNEDDPNEPGSILSGIDAIFSLSIRGTRQYLATSRQDGPPQRQIVVACDQDADLLDQVRTGRIAVLLAQNTFEIGRLAVMELKKLQTSPQSDSVAAIELPPLLITSRNVDSPDVAHFLKPYSGFDR